MNYDEALSWLLAQIGKRVLIDIGSGTGEDPEYLAAFSGRLARGTDNPIGAGGDLPLLPPDPSLWFWIEGGDGSAYFVLAPHFVSEARIVGEDSDGLVLFCGPIRLDIHVIGEEAQP